MTSKNIPLSEWLIHTLIAGGLLWWFTLFFLASFGCFFAYNIIGAFFLAFGGAGYLAHKSPFRAHPPVSSRANSFKQNLLIFLGLTSTALFFVCALSPLLGSPTIFSGRDQGSYSLAALQLAHSGRLSFDSPAIQTFFSLSETGKALNFPGFAYTPSGSLTPQFPLGSIVWYAGFVSIFGLAGFFVANVITAIASTYLFFFLLRTFLPLNTSLFGAFLFLISFPLFWFGRFTLSENLALPLFLLLSLASIRFFTKPSNGALISTLAIAFAFAVTRIEGWFILALFGCICLALRPTRHWLFTSLPRSMFIVILSGAGILSLWDFFLNFAFFRSLASSLWHHWFDTNPTSARSFLTSFFSLWKTLWLYALAPIFLIGGFSALLLVKKCHWIALIPFVLALPTCLYLIDANISNDHPWMLRRFAFSLWPTFLFLSILGIHTLGEFLEARFIRKKIPQLFTPAFFAFLFFSILSVSIRFLPLAENPLLLQDTATLSEKFSEHDLILVDRLASGDPFSMIADPLRVVFNRQAVYLFNPNDITRLDTSRFAHVFILTGIPEASTYIYALPHQLSLVDTYTLHTTTLDTKPIEFGGAPPLSYNSLTGLILEYKKP